MMNGLTALKDQHGEGTPYDLLQLGIGVASGPAVAGTLGNGSGSIRWWALAWTWRIG